MYTLLYGCYVFLFVSTTASTSFSYMWVLRNYKLLNCSIRLIAVVKTFVRNCLDVPDLGNLKQSGPCRKNTELTLFSYFQCSYLKSAYSLSHQILVFS